MPATPSGHRSLMASRCKKTLGQCTSWQSWTSCVGDEAAATALIATFDKLWTEAEVKAGRGVRAMLMIRNVRTVRGTGHYQGEWLLHIEAPVPAEYLNDIESAFIDFDNKLGAVLEEIRADSLADTTGELVAVRMDEQAVDGPAGTREADQASDGWMIKADVTIPIGLAA